MSDTMRKPRTEPAEREFPYVPRAVPATVQPGDIAPQWQPVPPARRRGGYAELARKPATAQDAARERAIAAGVPTRQRDPWQAYADQSITGWTTH